MFMSWEEKVRKVEPYVAGEQPKDPNIIKLNTNENPYPPSPKVFEAMDALKAQTEKLRLYPDMDASALVNELAKGYHVDPEQVFVGVGSDDVLSLCFLTFFSNGKPILFPDITYSFYDVWAELYRISYEMKPLSEEFTIRSEDYTGRNGEIGGIIFPNPNAPTAVEMPQEEIEQIIKENPDCVVIVDEAYVDFGAKSTLPLLEKYDNLLVVQTFSKSRTMAGLRIGFAIGNRKLIRYLKDVKFSFNSYTMNLPSIMLGTAQAEDWEYFSGTCEKIIATRERFCAALSEMGFVFPPSKANFVFVKHPAISGDELFAKLRARGIVVRHWNKPRIREYLRITIGTDAQMDEVIRALREIISESPAPAAL